MTTAPALLDYCRKNIGGIIYEYMQSDNLQRNRHETAFKFLLGNTIPGIWSFHHFESLIISSIGYKQTSEDNHLTGNHYLSNCPDAKTQVSVNDYI